MKKVDLYQYIKYEEKDEEKNSNETLIVMVKVVSYRHQTFRSLGQHIRSELIKYMKQLIINSLNYYKTVREQDGNLNF